MKVGSGTDPRGDGGDRPGSQIGHIHRFFGSRPAFVLMVGASDLGSSSGFSSEGRPGRQPVQAAAGSPVQAGPSPHAPMSIFMKVAAAGEMEAPRRRTTPIVRESGSRIGWVTRTGGRLAALPSAEERRFRARPRQVREMSSTRPASCSSHECLLRHLERLEASGAKLDPSVNPVMPSGEAPASTLPIVSQTCGRRGSSFAG